MDSLEMMTSERLGEMLQKVEAEINGRYAQLEQIERVLEERMVPVETKQSLEAALGRVDELESIILEISKVINKAKKSIKKKAPKELSFRLKELLLYLGKAARTKEEIAAHFSWSIGTTRDRICDLRKAVVVHYDKTTKKYFIEEVPDEYSSIFSDEARRWLEASI